MPSAVALFVPAGAQRAAQASAASTLLFVDHEPFHTGAAHHIMSTYTRQLLHRDAPLAIQELRRAFEENETALKAQAARTVQELTRPLPTTIEVPFLFDQLQVFAEYNVQDKTFNK